MPCPCLEGLHKCPVEELEARVAALEEEVRELLLHSPEACMRTRAGGPEPAAVFMPPEKTLSVSEMEVRHHQQMETWEGRQRGSRPAPAQAAHHSPAVKGVCSQSEISCDGSAEHHCFRQGAVGLCALMAPSPKQAAQPAPRSTSIPIQDDGMPYYPGKQPAPQQPRSCGTCGQFKPGPEPCQPIGPPLCEPPDYCKWQPRPGGG